MSGPARDEAAPFTPAWWLPGGHAQTLFAALRPRPRPARSTPERLELPDGDFVDLVWIGPERAPVVAVLHGLEGSVRSGYAAGLLAALAARGWRAVLMHFRGCSGAPNRLARSYHSGDTGDIAFLLAELARRHPQVPRAAVGFSLGGNALLKYLGELGESATNAPLAAAAAVSVPFDLDDAARRLDRGLSRLYQYKLLRSLKRRTLARASLLAGRIDLHRVPALRSFRAFDDAVTAPLHGFRGADEYYARSSSGPWLDRIRVPTLVLHARDDPFMTEAALPAPAHLAPAVRLELSDRGGHVGFIAGGTPWRPVYWLEQRIPDFLAAHLGPAAAAGHRAATTVPAR